MNASPKRRERLAAALKRNVARRKEAGVEAGATAASATAKPLAQNPDPRRESTVPTRQNTVEST